MSSSNILRLLRDALVLNGEQLDLVSGNVLKIRPKTADTGSINVGDGTYDLDVKVFLGSTTEYVLFDVGKSAFEIVATGRVSGLFVDKKTQTALTGTATVTAAQLLTKVLDGTPVAAATYTLPTAALLVEAIEGATVGDSFEFLVNNKSAGANTITVAGGSGGTADGTLTVAQNVIRSFRIILTNVTSGAEAYAVYGIGS